MAEITDRIQALLRPILASRGLELWDLEFRKEGPQWLLRLFIEREGTGATLDDCEAVSRDLAAILDVEDVMSHSYTLEVSSPGLDRTLSRPEHFEKCAGRRLRVKTFQAVNGQKVFVGILRTFDRDMVTIQTEQGEELSIPLSNIAKANLVVVF